MTADVVKPTLKDSRDGYKPVEELEGKHGGFTVYSERWWIMGTVILLNLANFAHWIAFPAIAKKAAAYYDVSGEELDLIPTVSYAAGVPTCLIATYLIESRGLKTGVRIGAYLTGFGGLLCCLSTFPGINSMVPKYQQYWMAVVGQGLTGLACPFISGVPTKISQHWFPDSQRTMATSLLGMSYPLGIVVGQGMTPLIITKPDHIPYMNIMFFCPAAIGAVLGILKVQRNVPITPPSASEASEREQNLSKSHKKMDYWHTLKAVFTNRAFVVIFLFLGGSMAFISCLATKMEQIMCSVGYSDELAGLACTIVIIVGALGTVLFGVLAQKTGKIVEITKLCCLGAIVCVLILSYLLLMPDVGIYILIASAFLGLFALGVFPLALELTVEATFPCDQATVTCFVFFSSSLQGVILMVIENMLGGPLPDKYVHLETCSKVHGDELDLSLEDGSAPQHLVAKDYTHYLLFVVIYMLVLIVIYMFFFKTELRRTNAGLPQKIPKNLSFLRDPNKDVESLLPGGLTMVRAISPRQRLVTC